MAGEQLHLVYHTAYDMPTTSLRLTNVYEKGWTFSKVTTFCIMNL